MPAHSEYHETAVRMLCLTALFLYGSIEGAVFKRPSWACSTWFMCLLLLSTWIVLPLTTIRIYIAAIVFISGIILMTIYYRITKKRQRPDLDDQ